MPELIQALHNPATRERAAEAIGNIGPAASAAIPELHKALADAPTVRLAAALHKVDPTETTGLDWLTNRMQSGDLSAAAALAQFGPQFAETTMPVLLSLLSDDNLEQWTSAAHLLQKISPNDTNALAVLRARFDQNPKDANVTAWLLRFDPLEPGGLNAMISALKSGSRSDRDFFVFILASELHTNTVAAAAPVLKSLLSSPERWTRENAAVALKRVKE